jgi:hypothetical protein
MTVLDLDVAVGQIPTVHRLALAVRPVDATAGRPAGPRLRVGRETGQLVEQMLHHRPGNSRRSSAIDPSVPLLKGQYSGAALLLYRLRGESKAQDVVIRIDDPSRRWVPRRLRISLGSRAEVEQSDRLVDPETGDVTGPTPPYLAAASRTVAPWLLPGLAYGPAATTTGFRTTVVVDGTPVRWPRIEAFNSGGRLIGWAHGNEHGEVLLLASERDAFPALGTTSMKLALRVHVLDPNLPVAAETTARLAAGDRLADLPLEVFPKAPPQPPTDIVTGAKVPAEYIALPEDVINIDIGQINPIGPLPISP